MGRILKGRPPFNRGCRGPHRIARVWPFAEEAAAEPILANTQLLWSFDSADPLTDGPEYYNPLIEYTVNSSTLKKGTTGGITSKNVGGASAAIIINNLPPCTVNTRIWTFDFTTPGTGFPTSGDGLLMVFNRSGANDLWYASMPRIHWTSYNSYEGAVMQRISGADTERIATAGYGMPDRMQFQVYDFGDRIHQQYYYTAGGDVAYSSGSYFGNAYYAANRAGKFDTGGWPVYLSWYGANLDPNDIVLRSMMIQDLSLT